MGTPVLAIVFHSRTGGAAAMARAAARGATAQGAEVRLLRAQAATPDDLLDAAGFVFAAPENLGGLSGPMKDLLDRAYYPLLERVAGRPYAALICAGSDGTGALRQIERVATGWRLRAAAEAVIARTGAQTPEAIWARKTIAEADLARCAEIGGALGAGLALGVF